MFVYETRESIPKCITRPALQNIPFKSNYSITLIQTNPDRVNFVILYILKEI